MNIDGRKVNRKLFERFVIYYLFPFAMLWHAYYLINGGRYLSEAFGLLSLVFVPFFITELLLTKLFLPTVFDMMGKREFLLLKVLCLTIYLFVLLGYEFLLLIILK